MLETTESLLPDGKLKVFVVSQDTEDFEEMDRLISTLGMEVVGRLPVTLRAITASTYFGSGKLEEVKRLAEACLAEVIILDVELSPNQLRNIEKILGKALLDRPGVIIEIFSRNARTREAKTQVSLARLEYLLPRLKHFWTHFERQRGGTTAARGMGEKQIEVDRRLVKTRMSLLKKRLSEISDNRDLQRSGRKDMLKVALVGYTNAGKSTLLNALTSSEVLAQDKLFATLDASIRILSPHSHPPVVAIDTVGFIRRLPPTLIASFRSTLEEVQEADLLLHVIDASSPKAREQMQVVEEVLSELKVDQKPRLLVLNKVDLIEAGPLRNAARLIAPGAALISALKPDDVTQLREQILKHFESGLERWEVLIPYDQGKLEAALHAHGQVEVARYIENGMFYRVRIDPRMAQKLELKRYQI